MNSRKAIPVVLVALAGAAFIAFVGVAGSGGDGGGGGGGGPGGASTRGGPGLGGDASGSRGSSGAQASGKDAGAHGTGGTGWAGTLAGTGGANGAGADAAPGDEAGASVLSERMQRFVRDLAYSKGLPEPPQSVVREQPDPWQPEPSREGPPPEIASVQPVRGREAGGERVEIRGRNLRVVTVMFGATPARLIVATDGLVAVEAPPGVRGPVVLIVTNDDGTWSEAPEAYVYGE